MSRANRTKSKGIVTWPEGERPRERLLRLGAQSLTDAELLAILLRIGFKGTSAVELGRQLVKQFGSLRAVAEAPLIALRGFKGLKGKGGAKAAQLAAALEIARRISLPDSREKVRIMGTQEAAVRLQSQLRGLPEEHFRVLFLNRNGLLLEDALLAVGSVDKARPPIRLIVARTLQTNASAVIVAHNHPSGVATASESDRIFTEDVFSALKPIGVKLLDHVIIGEDSLFSFADSGMMDEIALAATTG
ncbi:MAG: DNA repair protein RadC [Verrucomicrobia bacterium]|nr:DNA repair protein RadC [Verrucomicrobiota bacterium]MCG2681388.1 DNA repair protein RadC [Kiritimatiellia bacterium]MBU4248157.1 DNA repair protein RadC [Verrucomicrobiota bacterium]MBU4291804.1 DNA repair protein RadC [Verrucomicrobiota bacterium]MBU4427818.1 DNA repair protein RadC [Verrucomicrobiota bacterium]